MTERDSDHVIHRLEQLASDAASVVEVPPLVRQSPGAPAPAPGRRRRWVPAVAAAAALAVVVAVGAFVVGDGEIRTIDTADTDAEGGTVSAGRTGPMAPTAWPTMLDSEIDARDVHEESSGERLQLLEVDGKTAVLSSVVDFPMGQSDDAMTVDAFSIGGRDALWGETATGAGYLSVSVAPGQTLTLASRTTDRQELSGLVQGFDPTTRMMSSDLLPVGWAVGDDDAGLAVVLANNVRPGAGWSTVERHERSSSGLLSFSTRQVSDPRTAVEQAAAFGGTTAERVDLNGVDAVLLEGTGIPLDSNLLFWAPSDDTLVVTSSVGIDATAVLGAARSAQRLTETEWASLLADSGADRGRYIDGFRVRPDVEAVQTGQSGPATWMVVQEPGPAWEPESAPMVGVYLRDDNGDYGGGSAGAAGPSSGVIYARTGPYVVLSGWVPVGTTDVALELEGSTTEMVLVDVPGRSATFVFVVLDGLPIGNLDPTTATITGTLDDGAQFRSPPMTAQP